MENKKSYNVVLNSQQNISSNTNSSVEFGFDWSTIPKGSYNVHFTFVTNPKITFGSTSKPYAHLKNVLEKTLKPGEVKIKIESPPKTKNEDKPAINIFR